MTETVIHLDMASPAVLVLVGLLGLVLGCLIGPIVQEACKPKDDERGK